MTTPSIAERAWTARTRGDVEALIDAYQRADPGMQWRPVGDRPNNNGTITMASDPGLALIERITNALDAVLELGRLRRPRETASSPREAAQKWYGVPVGGLAELDQDTRRDLGDMVRLTLAHSGRDRRPTVLIDDAGTGQHPDAFPQTIVSLNEDNKVGKPWMAGIYGQGGSVTFRFSDFTVILSRRHPSFLDGKDDLVAWTVVRERHDPTVEMMPVYEYLVGSDHEVPRFEPDDLPELPHGTRVTHVGYDIARWEAITNLWQFLHSAMFDPVMPYTLTGEREKDERYGVRTIVGNRARLDAVDESSSEIELAHSESITFDLGDENGSVRFNYWVLQRPEGSTARGEPADSFVPLAKDAIAMTIHGQRHDNEARTWIKDKAKLPFLYKNMVIQIDADGLTFMGKNRLFASTRERATETELRDRIYEELGDVLARDEELKRLNKIERERRLSQSTATTNKKIRQRLAKFVKTHLDGVTQKGRGGAAQGDGGTQSGGPRGGVSKRDTDDSAFGQVPTKLIFRRGRPSDLKDIQDEIEIRLGRRTQVWVHIDAKNGYLPDHSSDLHRRWTAVQEGAEGKIQQTTRSKLLGGLSRWVFDADEDVPLGTYEFEASLDLPKGATVSDTLKIKVVEPPPAKPKKEGQEPATGPDVRWVTEDQWSTHDFDGTTVGRVDEDEDETIIWINADYRLLNRALSQQSETAAKRRKNRYQFPVAAGLYLQHYTLTHADEGERPPDIYLKKEQQRLAEAVLAAIEPDDLLKATLTDTDEGD